MKQEILSIIPEAAAENLRTFEAIPQTAKVQGGNPSVPPELLAVLPVAGEYKAAKVLWPSFQFTYTTANTEKNRGKIFGQFSVKVEVSGATGTYRGFYSDLEEFAALAEGGTLQVARFETPNLTKPSQPYQNLKARPAAVHTATAEPALVGG